MPKTENKEQLQIKSLKVFQALLYVLLQTLSVFFYYNRQKREDFLQITEQTNLQYHTI